MSNPSTQWKKGESGNPAGKPKGTYSLVTILKRKLKEAVEEGGVAQGEELVENWIKKAKTDKDFKALESIVKYVDGMPQQKIDHTTMGKPLYLPSEILQKNDTDSIT